MSDLVTTLEQLRTWLLEVDGVEERRVYDYLPEHINPPALILAPAAPWLEDSETFDVDEMVARFTVYVMTDSQDNRKALRQLARLVPATIAALPPEVAITNVGPPALYAPTGGGRFPFVPVTVGVHFTLTNS